MIIVIAAAMVAAPVVPATPATPQSVPMQHQHGAMQADGQHSSAMKDCCPACCKDMEAKMNHDQHAEHSEPNHR